MAIVLQKANKLKLQPAVYHADKPYDVLVKRIIDKLEKLTVETLN